MTLNPKSKGALVTAAFTVFGAIGWFLSPDPAAAWPEALMYGLLMVQTWFSLPLFFSLSDPKDKRQMAVDALLAVAYAFLAWCIQNPYLFYFAWTVFFNLTLLKYVMLVGRFQHQRLLRRKLVANVLGTAMGILIVTLFVVMPEQPWQYLGLAIFGGACVHYLLIRPLYDAREHV
ncbi:hypothetical protein M0Q28_01990 [Patescibacteria group bacterium]|jgi:glucose uptake protein GlcU|nr:hypothetical protein [Patescibacteria group bacterium]